MSFSSYLLAFFSTILAFICSSNVRVSAQVIPDNSLGTENSVVSPNATIDNLPADLIEGGAIRGENLFHSFAEFNISDGGRVYFANPDGIANILTRVTGNNISEIFNTLGVDGTANLWLINPNGIVFGENAALDINGSFLATTADSYIFNNGFAYSATHPEIPPLLTVNIPIGVQFGDRTNSIINRSQFISNPLPNLDDPNEAIDFFGIFRGLQVSSGQNITLIGGDLILEGKNLSANIGFF